MGGSLELFLSSLLELSHSDHKGLHEVVHPVKVQDDLELSSCFLYLHFLHLFPFSYHQGSHEPVDQVEVQDDLQDHDGRQEEGPDLHAVVQSGVRIGETSKEASGHSDSSHQPDHLEGWDY